MEKLYKITEVTKKYNTTVRTLRWYEEKGLIESIRTPDYAYRMYTAETLKILERIFYFRKLDISLTKIAEILESNSPEEIDKIINEKRYQINRQVERLDRLKDSLMGQVSDYDTSRMQFENYTVAEKINLPLDQFVFQTSPQNELYRDSEACKNYLQNGEIVIRNREWFVFFNKKFNLPLIYTVVAKTSKENIRLYAGSLNLIIGWEIKKNCMVFDMGNAESLYFPMPFKLKPDRYYTIKWMISEIRTNVQIDGQTVFNFENDFFAEVKDAYLGLGTLSGSTVTVKSATYELSEDGDNNPTEFDFKDVNFNISTNEFINGDLVMRHVGDIDMMTYDQREFQLPLVIDVSAKLQKDNFRVYFGKGKIIFNWEKKRFFISDPCTGEYFHIKPTIYIEPERFCDLRICFLKDRFILEKDGVIQLEMTDLPYIKHLAEGEEIKSKISVSTAFNNTVTVSRMNILQLKDSEEN